MSDESRAGLEAAKKLGSVSNDTTTGSLLTLDDALKPSWPAPPTNGGSQPVSSFGGENSDDAIVLPQNTPTLVTGISKDYQFGTGITLTDGGASLTIVAGVYIVTAQVILDNGVGTTGLKITVVGTHIPNAPSGSSFNGNLPLSEDGSAFATGLLIATATGILSFGVRPTGGSGDDGLAYFGVDITNIGPSAAAV